MFTMNGEQMQTITEFKSYLVHRKTTVVVHQEMNSTKNETTKNKAKFVKSTSPSQQSLEIETEQV